MKIGKNFCIAPFTQMTFSPSGYYSPCPEIGGRAWKDPTVNVLTMWNSEEFNSLRKSFHNNEKSTTCNRCWHQEDSGNQSLRKRLFANHSYNKTGLVDFLKNKYTTGPKQINIIVGNKCNLRCRICRSGCSSTYNIEGQVYQTANPKIKNIYISESNKPYEFTSTQIQQIFDLCSNVERIEFYGGEPLLDLPTLELLDKLVESGLSKNITLFYNTNGTNLPLERHVSRWQHFKALEFNFSIDDIKHRFTYNRHPGKWEDLLATLNYIRSYTWSIPVMVLGICTISVLNIYYLPEIIQEFKNMKLNYFLNTLFGPDYYDIRHLPTSVKQEIHKHLESTIEEHDRNQTNFLLNMLNEPTDNELSVWEDFKFWTSQKDTYRNESFQQVMPEMYQILKQYDSSF